MRILSLVFVSLFLLSSCTWGGDKKDTSAPSPYPSKPLGMSTDIGLPPNADLGTSYTAKGTEPFWSVDITPGKSILTRPSGSGVSSQTYITTQDDKGGIVSVKGVKGEFFVNLIKGVCSDGMSDTKYTYNATVSVGAESLTGCAMKP